MSTVAATVEQPRPFGYVVGDLIEQRVLLQSGNAPQAASLPRPGRLSVWLERRAPTVAADSQGRKWLVIDYQLLNAPQSLTTINLPAWQMATRSGQVLSVPQWPVSVGPLTARTVVSQGGLQALRADRPAPVVPTEPIVRQLELWSGAFLLTLALWVGWLAWRNWQASRNRPFARAAREMRKVPDDDPRAWQALHRAFDRAAGRVVQTATLASLFERASHLAPLRTRIEEFFAQSVERFFGSGGAARNVAGEGVGISADTGASPATRRLSVHALCHDLLRIERRHER